MFEDSKAFAVLLCYLTAVFKLWYKYSHCALVFPREGQHVAANSKVHVQLSTIVPVPNFHWDFWVSTVQ
jgi:hypothetical protein